VAHLTFDLEALTYTEYRDFTTGKLSLDKDTAILAAVSGLSTEQVAALTLREWKRLLAAFFQKAASPLDDPN